MKDAINTPGILGHSLGLIVVVLSTSLYKCFNNDALATEYSSFMRESGERSYRCIVYLFAELKRDVVGLVGISRVLVTDYVPLTLLVFYN